MTARSSKLHFYGGTGSVTGANFVLDTGGKRIMVDCGLEQGEHHTTDDPNARPFAYDPSSIDALFITHGHIDHIGRVPKLVHDGYTGPIYSTQATKEITALMFDDALGIMAHEQKAYGTVPLYERKDAEQALSQWKTIEYHAPNDLGDGISVRLLDAGHVLGSCMYEFSREGRRIVFTGDLGNSPEPLLRDTEALEGADYLLMESVYGDRVHEHRDERRDVLREAIEETRKRNGVLLVPSFSLERTQVILYEIRRLIEEGGMQPIDTYLDSPLARKITAVYERHVGDLNEEAREEAKKGDLFSFPGLTVSEHPSDSEKIAGAPSPKVIIAGSGMSHGGRIQDHERRFLGENDTEILFVGYQAVGTAGRRIQEGEKKVKIDGAWVSVHASVRSLDGYSGHKDRDGLMQFVENTAPSLKRVFVAMGEPRSAMFLAQRIHDFLGLDAIAPHEGDSFDIEW